MGHDLSCVSTFKKKGRPAFRSTYRLFEFDLPLYVFWNAEHNSVGPVSAGRWDPWPGGHLQITMADSHRSTCGMLPTLAQIYREVIC